ncbi:MAG: flippase [Candidatus Moraniibacteriota bacterium]|nr:MAG: flippase [Candidatus Moranbacteria bacterium]
MSTARKIAYNVGFSAFSKVLSTVLALVSIGLITRYLGPEGFGEYTTTLAFFALFMAIADFGLNAASTREISRKKADEAFIMGNVFTLRLIISLSVILIVPVFVFFLPYSSYHKIAIILSLIAFFFSSSYTVLNGIFQKNLSMDRVALTELIGKCIQVAIIFIAIKMNMGLLAIMSSLVVFMAFNFFVLFFWSRKFITFSFRFDISFWKVFLRRSFPLGISVLITFFYFKFDAILLSFIKGPEAVGIYGAAYKIIENVVFFPAMIIGLVLPLLAHKIFDDKKGFQRIADATAKTFFLIVIPMLIGGFMLAEQIILLIGGAAFIESVPVLQILLFALGCMFFGHLFNAILIVANKEMFLMKFLFFCALGNLALNVILIPKYSFLGAAMTSVITEFCVTLLTGWAVKRKIGYFLATKRIERILISGGFMALAIFLCAEHFHFFVTLGIAMFVYGVSIFLTRAVTREELQQFFPNRFPV